MPRKAKGARLYLDRSRGQYVIRDGTKKRGTGCSAGELEAAQKALAAYLAEKYTPVKDSRPSIVTVDDVITFYSNEIIPKQRSASTSAYAADRILDWWSGKSLSEVKRSTCKAYADFRTSQKLPQAKRGAALEKRISAETARRELTVLRAAINAYHAETPLDAVPVVTLPEAAPPRARWLTRAEAARFLRTARKHPDKAARRALIRFFILGIYSGTRSGAIRELCWMPNVMGGWVDLTAGVLHRRAESVAETKKRRPPIKIPRRLLGHLQRWHEIDTHPRQDSSPLPVQVVHVSGETVLKQRRSWEWVRDKAGLGPEVVPHILRHTAATWLMQSGATQWDAANFLGMSPEVLWDVYGHHHPDFQKDVADRVGRKPK
jgi:integrase